MITWSKLCLALALSLAAALSGCASYERIADYPTPNQPARVTIAPNPVSTMSDLPTGTYFDAQRQIIVRGAQGNVANVAAVFGLIGAAAIAIEHQASKSSAESQISASANGSTVDLVTMTKDAFNEAIAGQRAPGWTAGDTAAQLKLSPYAVFTVLSSGKACLHAMLRAEVLAPGGKPQWWTRYFARAPGEYTIEGADGWMVQHRFADGMRVALRRALEASMDDAHGKLTTSKRGNAKGQFPYIQDRNGELPVIIVQESKDTVVARMVLFDNNALAGTHVLDRADFALTDAQFPDPRH